MATARYRRGSAGRVVFRGLAGAFTLAPLLVAALWADDENQISVRLEPALIGVGEMTELVIEASGESLLSVPLQPRFELQNLEVAGGPSRRQNMSWANGQVTRTSGLSWYLRATAPGEGRVESIVVQAGDRELSFPDKIVRITEEPQQRRQQRRGDPFGGLLDDFFRPARRPTGPLERPDIRIEATISDPTPFRGEQILYTLYLLVESLPAGRGRAQVESVYPRHIPTFEGFWTQEVELPSQMTPESVTRGGKTYWRQPTLRRALFPYNAGAQTIEAAELEMRTVFLQSSRFGPAPTRPVSIPAQSAAIQLDVRPLPPPPTGFSGAVGRFDLSSDFQPHTIESDESATLSLALSGSGQINGVEDPRLVAPTGLKAFPPQGKSRSKVRGNRVVNTRSWEYTLVPELGGSYVIPPIQFVYFDPRNESYETLAAGPNELTVEANTVVAPEISDAPSPPAKSAQPSATEAEPTVTEAGEAVLSEAGLRPSSESLQTLVGAGAGLLALGGVLLVLRRRRCPAKRQLLRRLRTACAGDQPRAAAGSAEEAWRDFLQDQWEVPTGQPCSQWPNTLAAAGVSTEVAESLVQLMDDLHYLRYAPQLAASDAMQEEFWQRSKQLLRRLPR